MLQNKDVPPSRIQELKNQCRKAELGSYFLRYDIPVSLLRSIIVSTAKNVIKAIACKPGVAMTIRMNDAVAVFNLFREVFDFFGCETAENLIYTLVIRHIMEVPEWSLKELQSIVLSIKSPELRRSQIKTAIGYCTALLNGKNPAIREQATTSALMLIRLSDAEQDYADVKRNVQCLQALLRTFNATVMYNVLTERSKAAAKKLILDFTLDSAPTVGRIFSFGSLLGLSPLEIGATLLDELIMTTPISMLVLIIRETCQNSTVDKSGVVMIVQGLHGVTQRMQDVAEDPDFDSESARELAVILSDMNCLGPVVDAAAKYGMPQTETLVTLCSYLSLCDHVLSALVIDDQKAVHSEDEVSKFVK
uniref:Adaptin_N domain-containing protein n=1 Tax=Panagrellus redivivus TaxID=6233 RepID=A0A7E4V488_PANRE